MTSSEDFHHACNILTYLGITANYAGFYQTAYAVTIAVQNPDLLQALGKWLYPEVAQKYNTGSDCVERNIRKCRNMVWDKSRELLIQMAGHPLARRPGNARFLALLVHYVISIREDEKK